jgi:hypothetical protein
MERYASSCSVTEGDAMQKIARKFNILNEKALFLFVVIMTATNADAAVRSLPGEFPMDGFLPRLFSRMMGFFSGVVGQIAGSGVIDIPPGLR